MIIRHLAVIKVLSLFKGKLLPLGGRIPNAICWWDITDDVMETDLDPFILFSRAQSVTQSIFFFFFTRPSVIYFHRRNPLRKCNLPNRIKRIGQPDGHAGWTGASNVPLPPPPCSAYKRDAICSTQVLQEKGFGYQIDLLDRIECSSWRMRGTRVEKINSWRYSKIVVGSMRSVSQKRIPVSTKLLTLDRSFFLV